MQTTVEYSVGYELYYCRSTRPGGRGELSAGDLAELRAIMDAKAAFYAGELIPPRVKWGPIIETTTIRRTLTADTQPTLFEDSTEAKQ
jgi:hypothetical protein